MPLAPTLLHWVVTLSCNLLVHSSSLSMERCSIDVPGLPRKVSMHGRVIGPKNSCLKCREHVVQEKGLGQSIPRALRCRGLPSPNLASLDDTCLHESVAFFTLSKSSSSLKTCEKYGLSRHPHLPLFDAVCQRCPVDSCHLQISPRP